MSPKLLTQMSGGVAVLLAALAGYGSVALLGAEDASVIPSPFPHARYEGLVSKSPFAVATAAPEVVAPTENFATNWIVTGLSKNRGQDGSSSFTVFVRSRDLATRLVLTGNKPSPDGVSVVSVDEAPIAAKSMVTLKKGEETGKVGFDQAAISATPPPSAPAPPGASPAGRPPVKPTATAPRAPIPRPGMSAQPRAVSPLPAAPQPVAPRGRVRTVEEAPAAQ